MTNTTTASSIPHDDPTSPYFVHPSENPCAVVVPELFNGDNYQSWSRSFSIALSVKNKSGFIDGTLPTLTSSSDPLYNAWTRGNSLVLLWLLNSVSKDIRYSLLYFTSAFDVWEELRTRYVPSDGLRVFQLEKTLRSLSQGSQSITRYYNSFKSVWDEYLSYRPIVTCSCGVLSNCRCDFLDSLTRTQHLDCVLRFLVGLDDSFAATRSRILLTSPLPSLAKVYSLLLQEESQLSLQHNTTFDTAGMLARQPSYNTYKTCSFKNRKKVYCSHCGFPNHTADKCFQLIGYPSGWKGPRGPCILRDSATSSAVVSSLVETPKPSCSSVTPELYKQFMAFAKHLSSRNS